MARTQGKTKKRKTTKPTGGNISRNGKKFTLTWKRGDKDYKDGIQVVRRFGSGKWGGKKKLGGKATSWALKIDTSKYYPNKKSGKFLPTLKSVSIAVRGKRKKFKENYRQNKKDYWRWVVSKRSDWTRKTFPIHPPKVPSGLKATLDDTFDNVTTFTWNKAASNTDGYWFTDFEWQSKLFKESNITKGKDLDWSDASTDTQTGTSKEITEQTELLAETSYTRWFRVRSRGPAGNSAWAYARHVYSVPQQTKITETSFKDNGASGYLCFIKWSAPASESRPIKKMTVQYTIATPEYNMMCPDDASWTDAKYLRNTGTNDAASFPIDRVLGLDQCLYVRINTQYDHETNVTYGVPTLVTDGVGFLRDPEIENIEFFDATFRAEITAKNNSDVPDSFLVVVYRPESDPTSELVVGTIPHGQTVVQVQAPDWSGERTKAFGVYAAVGDINNISRASALMKSENIVFRGGEIPTAPQGVSVSPTDITGTVRVKWDWTWENATGAELSWSDHDDAWESTNEPSTYEISQIKAPQWNISGLETGVKWYVRVRLISGTGDDKVYGPYSEITDQSTIDLTSAPSIPSLQLSSPVVTMDGTVVASWVYSTTDGTEQSFAEICEATITPNGIRYGSYFLSPDISVVTVDPEGQEVVIDKNYYTKSGDDYTLVENVQLTDNPKENGWYEYRRTIASTETEQRIAINPAQIEGWTTGETYMLCVRVISAAGRVSDEWSAPVALNVAEPLNVSIANTSLEQKTQVSGESVIFDTEQAEEVYEAKVIIEPIQEGEGDPSPDNIRHINGSQNAILGFSDTEDGEDVTTYQMDFGMTVYSGVFDFITGILTVTSGYIDSYNGEELPSTWISDRDLYRDDVLPTIGAQVVYDLDVPVEHQLDATSIQTLVGDNYVRTGQYHYVSMIFNDIGQEIGMLREMPLTLSINGVTDNTEAHIVVEREEAHDMMRPDETMFSGYKGETIALKNPMVGEDSVDITVDDLVGSLDDGAVYKITVTVKDSLGQSAQDTQKFTVHWLHQAIMPLGTAVPEQDTLITRITPIAPVGTAPTDVCDIYRLSVDRPEMIVQGASFGTEYVDPFPAIGQFGGHRLVFRTENGDYITDENGIAWLDLDANYDNIIESEYTVIDFPDGQILLEYNVDVSNKWDKDFEVTQYLGGSVHGDWNPAVKRTGTINSEVITLTDQKTIRAMRRLAVYAGVCHVRTKDGSSFAADVQVSESSNHDKYGTIASFSLSITRVDQEQLDGMTAEAWDELNGGE